MMQSDFNPIIPWPSKDDNKYTRGKAIVIGGSAAYPGAAALAALAAQRMGAGYVEVFCHSESMMTIRSFAPSLVVRSWDLLFGQELLASKAGKPVAYVIGPGFDADQTFEGDLLEYILAGAQAPVLVDGGALGALARSAKGIASLRERKAAGFDTVLTPHGGEAFRLANALGIETVRSDAEPTALVQYAADLAASLQSVVALKGPDTYVCDSVRVASITEGTPALAKAGTGDVLAGLVGSYLAQGAPAFDAAVSGVAMHARAGCVAERRMTSVSVVPEDVVNCIPEAIRSFAQ